MDRTFTLEQARELLPDVRERAAHVISERADLADLAVAMERGEAPRGAVPEAKALQASLDEAVDWFRAQGLQVKGIAPLLLDFPAEREGRPVLLCWLEGEEELGWYHPLETGYLGRRRL